MSDKVEGQIKKISDLINEIKFYESKKKELGEEIKDLSADFNQGKIKKKGYKGGLKRIFGGRDEKELINEYNDKIIKILEEIKKNNNFDELFAEKKGFKFFEVKEGEVDEKDFIKEFIKSHKKKKTKPKKIKYVVYRTNFYNVLANKLFGGFSKKLIDKYPKYFRELQRNLRLSNLKIFSNTYISVGIFSVLITIFLVFILSIIILKSFSIFSFIKYIALTLLIGGIVLVGWYYYPRLVMDSRRREIKQDLPFAIIHMATVAGSGAQLPIVFAMLLESGEYKGLEGEIKRIMNYVNLFGYNMSTALKMVANTTPSPDFKELLDGMVETIGSGGSLKTYLKNKAEDVMTTYRLERRRYVETLSTYSDIYTAILIAAPLLFIIVLVLLQIVGSKIGEMDIGLIENLGTYVIVPALNIAFIIFLNMIQPEM